MYKEAIKAKLTFSSQRGLLSVQDLFDLRLTDLDTIAKDLNRKLKVETDEESFISTKSTLADTLTAKLDIVKDVIKDKMAEEESRKNAAAKRAERANLLNLIAEKEQEDMKSKSVADLRKQLAELDA